MNAATSDTLPESGGRGFVLERSRRDSLPLGREEVKTARIFLRVSGDPVSIGNFGFCWSRTVPAHELIVGELEKLR